MGKALDITGQRFGRLVAVERSATRSSVGRFLWRCACDCGNEKLAAVNHLRSGATLSCGCLQKQRASQHNRQHGHAYPVTGTYRTWASMLSRCNNPNRQSFSDYGARGIGVCGRWFDFEYFLADMGERPPGASLDRVDNNGHYEPGNCRWATAKEQAQNRRPRAKNREGLGHGAV